jgi:hypothetical protein
MPYPTGVAAWTMDSLAPNVWLIKIAIFKAWAAGFEKSVATSIREKIISLVAKCGSWSTVGREVATSWESISMPF